MPAGVFEAISRHPGHSEEGTVVVGNGSGSMLSPAMHKPFLPAPPTGLNGISLFFDFDGTLVDLAPTPDGVIVGEALMASLGRLALRLPGRVAIVSGRSIRQLDALLGGFARSVAVAGSHGAERRLYDEIESEAPIPPEALAAASADLALYAEAHDLLAERKTFGIALHYRHAPTREEGAVAAATAIAARHGLVLQRGKMMVEVRADGDKGRAVRAFLDLPAMRGTRPLFFGDDLTDEDGFVAAAAAGGAGVLVGDPRETAAVYGLADAAAVKAWIDEALEACR